MLLPSQQQTYRIFPPPSLFTPCLACHRLSCVVLVVACAKYLVLSILAGTHQSKHKMANAAGVSDVAEVSSVAPSQPSSPFALSKYSTHSVPFPFRGSYIIVTAP